MPILIFVLLALILLAGNAIYCRRRIIIDVREGQIAEATLGVLALFGAFMAPVAMIWATLASLAHL